MTLQRSIKNKHFLCFLYYINILFQIFGRRYTYEKKNV